MAKAPAAPWKKSDATAALRQLLVDDSFSAGPAGIGGALGPAGPVGYAAGLNVIANAGVTQNYDAASLGVVRR